MINVATYDAAASPPMRIAARVTRPARWRINLSVNVADGPDDPREIVIRVEDRMWLSEVSEVALNAIREIVPEGGSVRGAKMQFWAEV